MERITKVGIIVSLLVMSLLPFPAQAGDSGGVQASAVQLSLTPDNPLMGGSVDVEVTLYNSQQGDAFNVDVAFYKESVTSDNRLFLDVITVPGEDFVTVSTTWSGLTEGEHKVWFEFSAGGDVPVNFFKSFSVAGLPNLRVDSLEVEQPQPVYAGDLLNLSASILNSGSVDADSSTLLLEVPGSPDVELAVPALTAGSTHWVNTTIVAPSSGTHTVTVTPDIYNVIVEASESNKVSEVDVIVSTRMDLSFKDDLVVTIATGALEGPWTITGTLVRTNGTGPADIPIHLELQTPSGGTIAAQPFTVSLLGSGYSEMSFTTQLNASTLSSLPDGSHVVTARINPFNQAGIEQESTANDLASGLLTISPIPDVYVDANALPTTPSVASGEDVEWRITMENTGDIGVSGMIQYTFEGVEGQSPPILLDAGEPFTWTVSLPTALGAHTADFQAQWVASQGSWDANKQNSYASGTVLVESKLKLDWEYSSLQLFDAQNNVPTMPLADAAVYTLSVNMTSTETGQANYTCQDGDNTVLSSLSVNVDQRGERVSLSCTFEAKASMTTIRLVPEDSSISPTFTRSFATLASSSADDDAATASQMGTLTLFGLGALVLIGALVVAVILTREREEEVERDIYEYCPSCDGELEGTEDRCPHCMFNLKKARSQFHDCGECGESIPDLLENCAYCGAFQDVSSYFEKRERRERRQIVKEEVALPEDDDDQIVTGTENYAEAVKDFGFDEEHLEDEWDTNIVAAEAEVEAAYDRRYADEIAMSEMTEEEIEAYKDKVTTTLKSTKGTDPDHDIDAILASKGELRSLGEDTGELSASDAGIRERLFEITGEEGVLPGEKVNVGMSLTDSALAGNEVAEATANFSFDDDDDMPLSASVKSDDEQRAAAKAKKPTRRRSARQKAKDEAEAAEAANASDECGACGAELAPDAVECKTCGARFG